MIKRLAFAGLLAAMTFLSPAVGAADTLTLSNLSVGKGNWATITFTGSGKVETGWTGEINWLATSVPSGSFSQTLYTYCVDLFGDAYSGEQVAVSYDIKNDLTSATTANVTPGAGGRAAWLFNTYASTIHALGNTQDAYNQASALQLAIWTTMYAPGTFTYTMYDAALNASNVVQGLVSGYLTALGSNTGTGNFFDADPLKTGLGQDQISSVPEPATLVLLTAAMGATLGYRRRVNRRRLVAA